MALVFPTDEVSRWEADAIMELLHTLVAMLLYGSMMAVVNKKLCYS